ncbi:hypothetical protein JTE90_012750 [Oedothorax gibbosus]|uniref:G-protein coupled receptors family 1 profile domain-containing protein n=1 Tax=Oedothorax gibbosus TaxID=931172 RepID=A0AAV6VYY4_9ARAC|nr:hypothetical protein JTE90_012750 [Oedothorax gibbosus]
MHNDITTKDLSWNRITEVKEDEFTKYKHLQELNIANNLLESIPYSAFLKLSTLRTLNLQNNVFQSIPSLSFKPLVNLENLYLSYNEIFPPSEESFTYLPRLLKLFLDGASLEEIPVLSLKNLSRLELLSLAYNKIKTIPDRAFHSLTSLNTLCLENNEIEFVASNAFEGLNNLKVLEINRNHLLEIPIALASLPLLKELSFSDNRIRVLPKSSFSSNHQLTLLELSGNPLETFDKATFSNLPRLKKVILSEIKLLEEFPDLAGTSSVEHLRIDRSYLKYVPDDLCNTVPLLRSLNLKSNKLSEIPKLYGCRELRLIDLSYNFIHSIQDYAFSDERNLIDLFLSHNSISAISKDSFQGLYSLQVLDLESNCIEDIHVDAFTHFKELRDLNLGANKFRKLPTKGLKSLRELKTFNNKHLKEFPPVNTFPRISTLALSYAYHCCAFLASSGQKSSGAKSSLKESIVWLSKEDVDIKAWTANVTDIWPETPGNFSTKFEEIANQLWKTFGKDYIIPDNLASYTEEYYEDETKKLVSLQHEDNLFAKFALTCLPEPGPFMPCEDLFGWWSLRCGVWLVFLLALLGNGVVVIVLIISRSKMDVPRFLVCNLAAADFFMGIYLGMLAVVDSSTLGEFKVSAIQWQTSIGCGLAGFFGVLSTELSVFTLSIITLERNYAITHAMHLNKRLSLKHAGYIMLVGWIFASTMAAMPLFGVSDYKKVAICLPFETEDVISLSYVVFLIFINGVAFLILMGCYLKMYCAIRGSQAWNSNDSRIARRMALLVFTDFVCWAPIAFFCLSAVSGLQLISLEEAKVFAIFVLPFNSCANPFLYAIFTKQFKKDCIHICKRIEESRVTRGIGRGRHSSNFSNRQTPVTTNSAAGPVGTPGSDSGPQRDICRCSKMSFNTKQKLGWKQWAFQYFLCRKKQTDLNDRDGYTYAIAQIQRNMEKRNKHTSISSENFSSRSDSWRQGNIPLRLLDHDTRRGSWSMQRKASEDSNMSYSRQDSSTTSTFPVSRSSFSSESSSQPRPSRTLLGTGMSNKDSFRTSRDNKPKLCRQVAVSEEHYNKPEFPRHLIKEKNGLCPVCAKKEGSKSKELDEKFACFYNRLVESSCGETSETFSSKEDQIVFSSDGQSMDEGPQESQKVLKRMEIIQKPHIEVNPLSEQKNVTSDLHEAKQDSSSNITNKKFERLLGSSLDNKDELSKKSKSLVNINLKVAEATTKNSFSENSLIKIALGDSKIEIKSSTSHDFPNVYTDSNKTQQSGMHTSKSEYVGRLKGTKNDSSSIINEFNSLTNKSKSANFGQKAWSMLPSPTINEKNIKMSTSSPNITVINCETYFHIHLCIILRKTRC